MSTGSKDQIPLARQEPFTRKWTLNKASVLCTLGLQRRNKKNKKKNTKKTRSSLFSGSLLFYLMRQLFKENVIVIPGGHGLVS